MIRLGVNKMQIKAERQLFRKTDSNSEVNWITINETIRREQTLIAVRWRKSNKSEGMERQGKERKEKGREGKVKNR